ncbi:MAG TPA: Ig-like domain-containing protein [Bryobacteraceae bacterium]|nr:Ig-like domain-containing protein [Bryobacteraceae bacterium]HOQ44780.1 Ig-like domain-containing protein [Bryobacteraceae bacterium]HPQ14035.1 Ig-like domain-containing protein [Bryobacteraceae bacterium]HPU71991.1 Ig-like domain-containing protein [Bryobacteraceae bacterium]
MKSRIPQFLLAIPLLAGLMISQAAAQTAKWPSEYQFREHSSGGDTLKYVVYVPRNLEQGRKYPLAIYLHGSCQECTTHERILMESDLQWWHGYEKNVQREPTFLLAPAGGRGGWTGEARRKAVFAIIDGLIEEFPIDKQRIYLMGFSMGGGGVWSYLHERPGFFAAANVQGSVARTVDPEVVKHTPIWATMGINDNDSRLESLIANVARIRAANGDPRGALTWVTGVNPRLTIFPSTDHGGAMARTQQLPELADWFYSQVNDGNAAPTVRFIRPLQLELPYTSPVKATVKATDPEGAIERVEFRVGETVLFVDREEPYEYTFDQLTEGTHTLSARAFDKGGKSSTATVTIRVVAGRQR